MCMCLCRPRSISVFPHAHVMIGRTLGKLVHVKLVHAPMQMYMRWIACPVILHEALMDLHPPACVQHVAICMHVPCREDCDPVHMLVPHKTEFCSITRHAPLFEAVICGHGSQVLLELAKHGVKVLDFDLQREFLVVSPIDWLNCQAGKPASLPVWKRMLSECTA